jgi:hypothetical protein
MEQGLCMMTSTHTLHVSREREREREIGEPVEVPENQKSEEKKEEEMGRKRSRVSE